MKWETFWLKNIHLLPREPLRRRKIYVFLVCLFLSAGFWLIIKLSQESQGSFSQPVAITEMPEGYFLASKSHSLVRYSVRTTGARMLTSRYFVPTDTFYVNASGLPQMVRNENVVNYLTRSSIAFRIANQLRADVELVDVWPDTLFVEMVPAMAKKVGVKLHADIGFARRFHQYGPVVMHPDSVTITGPAEVIDTLTFIATSHYSIQDLNASQRMMMDLHLPEGLQNAQLSHNTVLVEIPVEEYTESSIEVPLHVRCNDETREVPPVNLVLFPPRVNITYLVALRDYGRIDTTGFFAFVTCPTGNSKPQRLEVVVERHPPHLLFQNVRPRSVEYLILR